jgi:long-chain acyl-CoA synthetase
VVRRQAGVVRPRRADLDAKLVDEDGNDLDPAPTRSASCACGAVVIKGYLNRPEATADAIRDGWFNTGDIARIDEDGFVFIVDRAKDMVLRGGENVYCSEVEAAIYEHDASPRRPCSASPTSASARRWRSVVLRPGHSR